MIVGVGVEWVDVPRFARALRRFESRLLDRLFTPEERKLATGRDRGAQRLAVRFAAKVAARRALGLRGCGWREFEVVRGETGRPGLCFRGKAARRARDLGVTAVHLSLSHDAHCGIGQVILEDAR